MQINSWVRGWGFGFGLSLYCIDSRSRIRLRCLSLWPSLPMRGNPAVIVAAAEWASPSEEMMYFVDNLQHCLPPSVLEAAPCTAASVNNRDSCHLLIDHKRRVLKYFIITHFHATLHAAASQNQMFSQLPFPRLPHTRWCVQQVDPIDRL